MSENSNGGAFPDGSGGMLAPRVQVIGQYVKDLSFENPAAPMAMNARPNIDLGVDIQARRLDDSRYEVELKLRIAAQAEERPVFLMELSYGGLFMIENVPADVLQQVLLIEAPHLLFPFARRIVADAVRDGGMPPLMIEPIDFAGLYRQRMEQGEPAIA